VTHPAVDWVLDTIETHWPAGSYSDIPLERIDRDNSELLDGSVTSHTEDLEAGNYVGASYADRAQTPIGTNYDLDLEVVVGVRIEGMLRGDNYGFINPDASVPPATAGDPVPWTPLVDAIRAAIYTGRKFPDTGRTNVDFTHLLITNEAPQASDYGDYYRHDFDVVFDGFETLS